MQPNVQLSPTENYSITDNPPPAPTRPPKSRSQLSGALSFLLIIVSAFLIAFLMTQFVFQSYEVDGPSMETTLQNRDRLIVYKVPRTWARLTRHPYIPNRGDVVIFNKRDLVELNGLTDKQLIKRVIGLPGDRVVVHDGVITIYNKEHPDGFNPDTTLPYKGHIGVTPGEKDLVIQPGEVFVCGDNRTNSYDSRAFGPISADDIVGKLAARILPLDKAKAF